MIGDPEVRRIARIAGIEPRIVELDYVLGWALKGIADHKYLGPRLVFKGGTCLRKCYFPDYRFSEDLDFTATEWFGWPDLEQAVREALARASELSGIDFTAREPKLEIIDDEYGRESLRLTAYWRGPHARGGSPTGLRLDITRNEVVVIDPVRRAVMHPFSDADELGALDLRAYALDEVMAEKIRAVLGQRRHAVSRDLYDISSLLAHTDEGRILDALPNKLAVRDVDVATLDRGRLTGRRDEFQADWNRNLAQLLPPGGEREFEAVWEEVVTYVSRVMDALDRGADRAQ